MTSIIYIYFHLIVILCNILYIFLKTKSFLNVPKQTNIYRARTSNCRIYYFILKLAWTVQIARYSSQIKNRFQLYSIYPRSTWNLTSQPLLWPQSGLISSGRTWPKPPFRLWPCKPWWIKILNVVESMQ
jgi:hypothetical protein